MLAKAGVVIFVVCTVAYTIAPLEVMPTNLAGISWLSRGKLGSN